MKRRFAILLGLPLSINPAAAQYIGATSNLVSGSASATGTGATTLISAPSATRRLYVTDVECGRSDAGTTASRVTLNDDATTVLVIPNSGGGGFVPIHFGSALTVASATALTFTSSASISTVYCAAQGFTGN